MIDSISILNFPVLNPCHGHSILQDKEDTTQASMTLFQVTIPIAVQMPNRIGFVSDPRPDVPTKETP